MKPTKKLSPNTKAVICTVLTVLLIVSGFAEDYFLNSHYIFLFFVGLVILLVVAALIFMIYLLFISFFNEE